MSKELHDEQQSGAIATPVRLTCCEVSKKNRVHMQGAAWSPTLRLWPSSCRVTSI